MIGFVLNMNVLVQKLSIDYLIRTGFVLYMTEIVLNMTKFIITMTELVLNITLNMTAFVLT